VHAKACTSCCDGCMQLSDQQMSMTSAAHPEPLSNALMPTLHRRAKCSRTHRLCACVLGRGGGVKWGVVAAVCMQACNWQLCGTPTACA
jgi:hypothetical protein